jgi:hypothetical protein
MGWLAAGTVLAALIAIVAQFQPTLFLEGSAQTDDAVKMGSGQMFDRVAPGYDLVNTVLTMKMDAAWRNEMITSLHLKPGQHKLMFDFMISEEQTWSWPPFGLLAERKKWFCRSQCPRRRHRNS